MDQIKPGWKSSEFAIALIVTAFCAYLVHKGHVEPALALIGPIATNYMGARATIKLQHLASKNGNGNAKG